MLNRRDNCLQTLTDAPQAKRDLVETLDIPRSTLDDIVRKLDDAGLVTYQNGKWGLTNLGQYAIEAHANYTEQLESLLQVTPVVEELPSDTTVEYEFLIDADVYMAPTKIPDKTIEVFLDSVESATEIRGFTPIVMAGYAEDFYQAVTAGDDYQLDLVLPEDVFNQVRELYSEQTDEALTNDQITFVHCEVPATYTLWIADNDHAGIIVYTERGIQGILINDTDEALSWAVGQYEHVRDEAEPLVLQSQ
ncbi:hypothetical protein C439_17588 [Haloferax mediterranei ATCC 33500]|uniref:Uncharacterized protein n=1 Tax=Haloferax mediterranei (strain ATCC 33500 / DSM 1411 / JCM 8866 / NBRC 14739 / NCIMB 2177 / R-4) TaxID=523841 RepID=M0IMT2_HALMT|nr:hypothetical protein C439_17588 [Haloferax mediterranei ATCC 33500]